MVLSYWLLNLLLLEYRDRYNGFLFTTESYFLMLFSYSFHGSVSVNLKTSFSYSQHEMLYDKIR